MSVNFSSLFIFCSQVLINFPRLPLQFRDSRPFENACDSSGTRRAQLPGPALGESNFRGANSEYARHQWLRDYSKKHGTSACSSRSRPASPCALVRLAVTGLDSNTRKTLYAETRSSGVGHDAARAFGPGTLDADAHQDIAGLSFLRESEANHMDGLRVRN